MANAIPSNAIENAHQKKIPMNDDNNIIRKTLTGKRPFFDFSLPANVTGDLSLAAKGKSTFW